MLVFYSEVLRGRATGGTFRVFTVVLTAALPPSLLCFDLDLRQFVSFHAELNIFSPQSVKSSLKLEKKTTQFFHLDPSAFNFLQQTNI